MYLVLGGVFMLYLIITLTTRSKSKERKSKKFMDGYKREDKKSE